MISVSRETAYHSSTIHGASVCVLPEKRSAANARKNVLIKFVRVSKKTFVRKTKKVVVPDDDVVKDRNPEKLAPFF